MKRKEILIPVTSVLTPAAVDIRGAAQVTGLSRATIYRAITAGNLVARKHGGPNRLSNRRPRHFLASAAAIGAALKKAPIK